MALVGLAVAGLVVWALTRTVEPAAAPVPLADATDTMPAVADTAMTALSTAPSTAPPLATTTTPSAPVPAAQTPPAVQGDRSEVGRIAVEDLRAKFGRGEVTIIDVRDAASFAQAHIPGALNIPMASIEAQLDRIPKDKPIVTYCT